MIPRSFKINDKRWKVLEVRNLKNDDGDLILGLCCIDIRTIWLESTMSKKRKLSVYGHEVLHAILFEIQAKLTYNENERVVEALENHLFKLFKITPKLKIF